MEKSAFRTAFVARLKELELTQEQVARAMNKSLRTVNAWVSGEYTPRLSPNETLRLCEVLQCSLDDLAEMFPDRQQSAQSHRN